MAGELKIDAKSVRQLQKRMQSLSPSLQRNVMRKAVRAAARLVIRKAKSNIPKGSGLRPSGKARKHLRQTLKGTSVKWYRKTNTMAMVVGNEDGVTPHSHLVHNGTSPHTTTLTKPLVLNGRVFRPGMVFHNPGAKANPYLADAVKQTRGQVQAKMISMISAGVERETAKMNSGGK